MSMLLFIVAVIVFYLLCYLLRIICVIKLASVCDTFLYTKEEDIINDMIFYTNVVSWLPMMTAKTCIAHDSSVMDRMLDAAPIVHHYCWELTEFYGQNERRCYLTRTFRF